MSRFIFSLLFLLSCSAFASCPGASSVDSADFCPSFETAAICYCTETSGLPSAFCSSAQSIYNQMTIFYGSLDRACDNQSYVSKQLCIDNWNCFMKGGQDSTGKSCSSTGKACI